MNSKTSFFLVTLLLCTHNSIFAKLVRLAHEPALSPDGKTVAFGWQGDLWAVPKADVKKWNKRPQPKLIKASERK